MNYFEIILSYLFTDEIEISITMVGLGIIVYLFTYVVQQLKRVEIKKEESLDNLVELYSELIFIVRRQLDEDDIINSISTEIDSNLSKIFKYVDKGTVLTYLDWRDIPLIEFEKRLNTDLKLLVDKNRSVINLSYGVDPIQNLSDWASRSGTLVFLKAGMYLGIQLFVVFMLGMSFSRSYGKGFADTIVASFPLVYLLTIVGAIIILAQVRSENKDILNNYQWTISWLILLGPIFFGNFQVWFGREFMNILAVVHFCLLMTLPFWIKVFIARNKSLKSA